MNEYPGDSNVNLMAKRPEDEDAPELTEEELEQLKEDLEDEVDEEANKS
jgi:hypothetical protein